MRKLASKIIPVRVSLTTGIYEKANEVISLLETNHSIEVVYTRKMSGSPHSAVMDLFEQIGRLGYMDRVVGIDSEYEEEILDALTAGHAVYEGLK